MDWLAIAGIGALVGWGISKATEMHSPDHGTFSSALLGIFGGLLGRWLFLQVTGNLNELAEQHLTIASLLWGAVGAGLLVIGVHAIGQKFIKH